MSFEKATRLKLRFETSRGLVTSEDLWDLPLTAKAGAPNLDDVARALHSKLKNGDDVSFVLKSKKSDEITQLKFDLVRHVIDVKLAEQNARAEAVEKSAQREQILAVLKQREGAALLEMSEEDLRKKLADLS